MELLVRRVEDVDVRLAEDHEQVALAGVLEVFGHVQIGVHARLEDGDASELGEFVGVGVVETSEAVIFLCGSARHFNRVLAAVQLKFSLYSLVKINTQVIAEIGK